jgi:eukaryotic-like serine/threonine-protein kinase
VIRTDPSAGATANRDATVTVVVSKGPDLVAVPAIKGLSVQAATAALDRLGLGVSNIFGPPSKRVFDSDPLVGTHVRRGSSVSLYTR